MQRRVIFATLYLRAKMKRILLLISGMVSVVLGVIGIFLPLLPTTPFLLLGAFLFARSSREWYDKLLDHKLLGPYIRNFRENKSIPLKVKVSSISLLWITIGISTLMVEFWWVRVLLLLIATGVMIHILSYKSN